MSTTDDLSTGNAPEGKRWEFDASVTEAFEDMLERSIPQYEVMRQAVTDAACWVAESRRDCCVIDLGASRGSALAPIVARLGADSRYAAYEISEPMLEACRERFAREVELGLMKVIKHDLRSGVPRGVGGVPPVVVLSVLTLQFVPIEYRQQILAQVRNVLHYGGAFIWVEKVLGATALLNELEVSLYHGLKRQNGYTDEAITRKAAALEGVLVPLTAAFNEDLLRQAGFRQVDCIWAWQNFRCWIAME